MLIKDITAQGLPFLHPTDTVDQAIQIMNDNLVAHLPLVDADHFIGLVSMDHLMQADDEMIELQQLENNFIQVSVKAEDHFFKALQLAGLHSLTVVPVVGEGMEMISSVSYTDLYRELTSFLGLQEQGGLIILERESHQFSFSEISKLVETNDAQVTQMNTATDQQTGMTRITIRINKPEISDIVATFQRYDYTILFYAGEELYANELKSNYDHLMHYLKI